MNFLKAVTFYSLLAIFIPISSIQAQEDDTETTIEYSEESIEESDFTFKEKYNYLIRADKEEQQLIKINLFRLPHLLPSLGYERKIRPAISFYVEGGPSMGFYNSELTDTSINLNYGLRGVYWGSAVRYYYNINNRIRKGKSANNFSANYLSIQTNALVITRKTPEDPNFQPRVAILYGIQRHIGDFGYVDFNFGYKYDLFGDLSDSRSITMGLQLGLAF